MKYLAIALIAISAITSDLAANLWLEPKVSQEWDWSVTIILLWCAGMWAWADKHES